MSELTMSDAIWNRVRKLRGKTLRTLDRQSKFIVTEVSDASLVVTYGTANREYTIGRDRIEHIAQLKPAREEIRRAFVNSGYEGGTSYAAAIVWELIERGRESTSGRSDASTAGGRNSRAEVTALEGLKEEARRYVHKRNRKLRDQAFKLAGGVCCVCHTDYSTLLDGMGLRVLQVHHRKQLAVLDKPRVNTVEDLAVVCANCHLLIHWDVKKAMEVETVERMLARSNSSSYPASRRQA